MSETDDFSGAVIKRERSPSFPYIDLATAIEHLEKIYSAARMNDVRLTDVADAWGMTAKSGSLMRYVAALGQFGLVDTSGTGESKRIRVSANGRRILEDNRPGVREALCSEAALLPRLIRGLFFGEDDMPQWGKHRPTDSIAESSLKFDLSFTADAARRFLTVYDATIQYIAEENSDQHAADLPLGEPIDDALGEDENSNLDTATEEQTSVQTEPIPLREPNKIETELNVIDFQNAGKGKIRISGVLDAEGLDLLEKKIAAFRILIS